MKTRPWAPRELVLTPILQTPEFRKALADEVRANQAKGLPW